MMVGVTVTTGKSLILGIQMELECKNVEGSFFFFNAGRKTGVPGEKLLIENGPFPPYPGQAI